MTVATVDIPGRAAPLEIDDDRWHEHHAQIDALEPGGTGEPVTRVRLAFGALHVVLRDEYASCDDRPDAPGAPDTIAKAIDWDTTLALRTRLAAHGFGIAEAMDTAQRFELGWPAARRLIEETGRLRLPHGFVAGAGTDHLDAIACERDLIEGVASQAALIQKAGGLPVLLPMPWLAATDADPDAYVRVYREIVAAHDGPVFVHWLGAMFAPELAGYFPGDSFDRVMDLDPARIRGAKLSLLDEAMETEVRRRLLERDQILLTGDDLNFPSLIEGTDPTIRRRTNINDHDVALGDFSHALLGIIDAIAPPMSLALRLLDCGALHAYREIMDECATLARVVFEPPTHLYKTGLAFIAWLNGHQPNAMLVNHRHRERPTTHLLRVAEAAAAAGAIVDADGCAQRLRGWVRNNR